MHFVVHALDHPDALPKRLDVIDAHRTYLQLTRADVKILMSGPLVVDDGKTMKGSFFLLDADGRDAVEAMFAGDPLAQAGIWQDVSVTRVWVRQNHVGPLDDRTGGEVP